MLIIRCATLNVITTSIYAMLTERNPVELPLVDVGDLVVVPADRRTRGRLKDVPARERDRVIKEQKCGRGDFIGGFPFVLPTLIMRGGGVTRRDVRRESNATSGPANNLRDWQGPRTTLYSRLGGFFSARKMEK